MGHGYSIASLKHRVAICSMKDVVVGPSEITLAREPVYNAWACIEQKRKSLFSGSGDAIKQNRETQTHLVIIRFRRDIDFTQAAWFYEQRLQSGARWFKVLEMGEDVEDGEFMKFSCRMVERGADISPPVAAEAPGAHYVNGLPQGVKL